VRTKASKFYFSHLNYAGRGNKNRGKDDAQPAATRDAQWTCSSSRLGLSAAPACTRSSRHRQQRRRRRLPAAVGAARFPDKAANIRARLPQWGGNSSGVNVANIDNLGNVHPDTMWWHYNLGNVRERPFSKSGRTPATR
jgi:MoaA/NifB/PqqE/SkfB family radical SAM enzyme